MSTQSETPTLGQEHRLSLVVVALLAAASVAASILIVTPAPFIDDTFIGVRYAINWAAGDGVVYNVDGRPVEGYTSIGWVTLFFLAIKAGLEPLFLTQVVNVLAQVATLFALYALGRQAGRSAFQSLFAPTLLAFHLSFVTYPMMGMTTSTFTLFMLLGTLMIARDVHTTRGGSLLLGVVLLLFSLTRFDGVGFSVGILLYPIVFDRQWRRVLPALAVLVLGLGLYNAWRFGYYGKPLPQSHYAKDSEDGQDLAAGIAYFKAFARRGGPFALLVGLVPLTFLRRFSEVPRAVKVATWMSGGHLVYTLYVGGDWMECFRFMLHILPLYCFLMQEGLWRLCELVQGIGLPRRVATLGTVLVMAVLVERSIDTLASSPWTGDRQHIESSPYWNNAEAFVIGDFLDEALPADCEVATEWAGIIPSRMRQPILDIFGLNDPEIIDIEGFVISNMGRGITPEYLVERAPPLVIVVGKIYPTPEAAEEGLYSRPDGTWVKDFYASLMDPQHGYIRHMVKIGEKGYWPCLIHPDSDLNGTFGEPF